MYKTLLFPLVITFIATTAFFVGSALRLDNQIKAAEASQIVLQNTIDNLPPSFFSDGSCESLEACAGSCDSVNACPLDLCYEGEPCGSDGEAYNCLPQCYAVQLQSINPFNPLNYNQPMES